MKGRKLTKRTVDSLVPAVRDSFTWDSELPGFGCKVTPTGARIYVLQYSKGSRKRRVTIGRHGAPWTPESARKEALRLKGEVAAGQDPAEVRATDRRAPTMKELGKRYLAEHSEVKKKPLSVREDRRLLEKIVEPRLGNRKVIHVDRVEVSRFHHDLRKTPVQANRALALVSRMLNLSERWGLRPIGTNPCRLVERFRERPRERFLSEEELKRLGDALTEVEKDGTEPSAAVAAIRFLVLTGCRLSEALELRWEHVDMNRASLRLPDSKTGAKTVLLGAPARELLAALPRLEGSPYVFPGRSAGRHLVGLQHVWMRLREKAKLPGVRMHDLRHSFASVGAMGGISLLMIGALLGHRQVATTQRYAHLSNDPVQAAAESIARTISAAMQGKAAQVRQFRKHSSRDQRRQGVNTPLAK